MRPIHDILMATFQQDYMTIILYRNIIIHILNYLLPSYEIIFHCVLCMFQFSEVQAVTVTISASGCNLSLQRAGGTQDVWCGHQAVDGSTAWWRDGGGKPGLWSSGQLMVGREGAHRVSWCSQ